MVFSVDAPAATWGQDGKRKGRSGGHWLSGSFDRLMWVGQGGQDVAATRRRGKAGSRRGVLVNSAKGERLSCAGAEPEGLGLLEYNGFDAKSCERGLSKIV